MLNLWPFLFLVLLLAVTLKVGFLYHIFYLLVLVVLLAHLWGRYAVGRLVVRRRFEPRAFYGETIPVVLEVHNTGWLPVPWLLVHERLPLALASPAFLRRALALWPRERCRLTYTLHARQRGYYTLGPLTVETGDVLGLQRVERIVGSTDHLIVYPKIVPVGELGLPSRVPLGLLRTPQPLYADPVRVIGVRPYTTGDSFRLIHWKATAATGALQVKKLEPAMMLPTVILLNLNLPEYERAFAYYAAELAIIVAASLANHLVGLRQEVGLLTNGLDSLTGQPIIGALPRKGRHHLMLLLEMLARVVPGETTPFPVFVRGQMPRLPWGATLVLVTPGETPALLESVLVLRRAGFRVVLVYVRPPGPAVGERSAALGLPYYEVWREEHLEGARPAVRGSR